MSKNSTKMTRPKFKSEKEEADWYHTPEGKAFVHRSFEKAAREGRLRWPNGRPAGEEAKRLIEAAQAAMLQPVSLRLPQGDIDKAKRLASASGKGYQTVLKEIIHAGLSQAH